MCAWHVIRIDLVLISLVIRKYRLSVLPANANEKNQLETPKICRQSPMSLFDITKGRRAIFREHCHHRA